MSGCRQIPATAALSIRLAMVPYEIPVLLYLPCPKRQQRPLKPLSLFAIQGFLPPRASKHRTESDHSFKSLGPEYYVDVHARRVKGARLVLFNEEAARKIDLRLPRTSAEIERLVLELFGWFKPDERQANESPQPEDIRTFFATRYQDSEDRSTGSALGDGRVVWMGEIIQDDAIGKRRYLDIVAKGTGVTPLAWLNHPKTSHRDGKLGITEAVHEYIYSLAAIKNGIDTPIPLAVIELPFRREGTDEKAAIIVRVGNHLRLAHYRYFSTQPQPLERIFEYGLKRDLGLPLNYPVTPREARDYLSRIVAHLAREAAVYFDLHAVHGSPTFGNRASNGGTIDLSTFAYLDAHHGTYNYMPGCSYCLGGKWGQHEQMFVLFSDLMKLLRASQFKYADQILPGKAYWEKFRDTMELSLIRRWLKRLGLAEREIAILSPAAKQRFYNTVRAIYEAQGVKKIRLNRGRTFLAAFEPRVILSHTARHFGRFDDMDFVWENLFKVHRNWGTLSVSQARPFMAEYIKSVKQIVDELDQSGKIVEAWRYRSGQICLSERREPGADFFYGTERFLASKEVLAQIQRGTAGWPLMSGTAAAAAEKLVDQGF